MTPVGKRRRLALAASQKGQDLVEFALLLPLLLAMFLGIMEFGIIILSYNTIANAAREGARYAIIHPNEMIDIDEEVPCSSSSPGDPVRNARLHVGSGT